MFYLMVKNPFDICLIYKTSKKRLHTLRVCDVLFDSKKFLRTMPVLQTLKEKIEHLESLRRFIEW